MATALNTFRRRALVLAVAHCLLGAAQAASVDGFSTSVLYSTVPGLPSTSDAHNFDNFSAAAMNTPTQVSSLVDDGHAYARGWGQASLGTLANYAYAMYPADASTSNIQTHVTTSNQNLVATVTSAQLADGTPVDVQFTMDITGVSGDLHGGNGYASGTVAVLSGNDGNGFDHSNFQLQFDTAVNGTPSHQVYTLHTAVGRQLGFSVFFDSVTGVSAFSNAGVAEQDFSHTLHYYIDGITPGVSIANSYGYDFSTPAVPEPASAALMLAGVAALGLRRLRR